jgi:putative FmdB family regulatory protein
VGGRSAHIITAGEPRANPAHPARAPAMLSAMPIYEYRCLSCTERFEELVRRPDETVPCPQCGGGEVERLLSVFAGIGGGGQTVAPDYSRVASKMATRGGCCGGGCGHMH